MRPVRSLRRYLALFTTSFKLFLKEFKYFYAAKAGFSGEKMSSRNEAILLRKYTHQLERFLFHPKAYSQKSAADFCGKIKDLIVRDGEKLSKPLVLWAQKIVREYEECDKKGDVHCPLLKSGVCRRDQTMESDQLLALMEGRRSRRVFENIPLTDHEKQMLTKAALSAPASCNRQTVELIFIKDKDTKSFVASTVPGGRQFFSSAPCIIVFVANAGDYRYPDDRVVPFIDSAAAIQNIYLLCETIGFGCCWGSYTSFGSIIREDEVRRRLKIPATYLITGALAIGKSSQSVCKIPRDPESDRYWNNHYGEK